LTDCDIFQENGNKTGEANIIPASFFSLKSHGLLLEIFILNKKNFEAGCKEVL